MFFSKQVRILFARGKNILKTNANNLSMEPCFSHVLQF